MHTPHACTCHMCAAHVCIPQVHSTPHSRTCVHTHAARSPPSHTYICMGTHVRPAQRTHASHVHPAHHTHTHHTRVPGISHTHHTHTPSTSHTCARRIAHVHPVHYRHTHHTHVRPAHHTHVRPAHRTHADPCVSSIREPGLRACTAVIAVTCRVLRCPGGRPSLANPPLTHAGGRGGQGGGPGPTLSI